MSSNPFYVHAPRRVCRLFWCYQCHCMVRIISSPSTDSFCPRCYGQFIHELDMPRPHFLVDFAGLRNPPTWQPRDNAVSRGRIRQREPEPAVSPATNPGDYFTGPGLNQLIDELTQNDRPGLPPAPVSAIDAMPTVYITEAHLVDGSQCPVCKEEFGLGEAAREMPCKHVYHNDCIVPWLRLHNSCPVCRYQLPGGTGGDSATQSVQESDGDGSGSRRQRAAWRNPFSMLWPASRGQETGWDYPYLHRPPPPPPYLHRPPPPPPASEGFPGTPSGHVVFFSLLCMVALAVSSLTLCLGDSRQRMVVRRHP